ncbi:acetylornithine/N-succinyldiaminopimelate aminotransferase [Paenibacillus endophyticus]|uniref:Acetylornithine/N-succinyldiaminopimelate aminotransferase n=1 Tax=Paenibacillus endophyticus TaxID=1294268 RepID=A0A7W5CAS1_9BACL|nr:aspartate aminotransferase family protein [Paenibacillus endophyticus]MBB3154293.1 acetylornithine/N-succinyldiaminopimelate aminotransferase [Paenibacillus endophyticus]
MIQTENAMTSALLETAEKSVLFTANRPNIVMERGKGMYLWDTDDNRYLDFVGGWAVASLGHSPEALQEALSRQAATLVHASPGYYNRPMLEFAELLTSLSGMDKVFFGSSGAEANESAIKLARKHGAVNLNGAFEIITLANSFHGRSLATMSATGKPHWKELFSPKVDGFKHVPINDLDAIFAAVTNQTCAIMIELVQGEGGVHSVDEAYLYGIRKICDMYGIMLIFDEVQTGLGRTGKLFAYEHYGIKPDVMTLGKGIGAGFPLSAMLAKSKYDLFEPGDQGGTYTGAPLAMAAGYAVLTELLERNVTDNAKTQGNYIMSKLEQLSGEFPITNIRGKGLLLAFDTPAGAAAELAAICLREGLLINALNPSTVRLVPPLIVSQQDSDAMLGILRKAWGQLSSS